jgi:deaminated glutathione amidase
MDGRNILAAAIQMSSTPNKGENLDTAERLIRSAASSGAGLIVLPELWNCHGLEEVYRENAEPVPGPTTEFLGGLAQELGVYLLGGSILEGTSQERLNPRNCIIHPPSSSLTARCRPFTARYTSST